MAAMSAIAIVPLTADLWPAVAALFEAGGDPEWCWCQYWRKPGSNWSNTTADQNRDDLRALLDREGPAPGLVALEDGRAVGWVGLGPREAFPRLARSRTIPQLPGPAVWVVNCFVVARAARRSGVAGRLLEAAVSYAGAHGAETVEGYPVTTEGRRIPSASVYTGTAGMFERAGFTVAAPTTSRASSGMPRVVVRRAP
jgi:GNAT superfamily N-acetyltransferase